LNYAKQRKKEKNKIEKEIEENKKVKH